MRRRRRVAPLIAAAVGIAAVVSWFGCGRPSDGPQVVRWPSTAAEVAAARSGLGSLTVTESTDSTAYRRAAFGDAWTDIEGNGCNQRDDVLLRDVDQSQPYRVGQQRDCDHDLLSGTWVDPYTGTPITLTDAKQPKQAESVQIDHIVPLAIAWRDGASRWSPQQRLTFANDLTNLVAASGTSNQRKGGSDASGWRPPEAAQCGYAVRYVTVKHKYSLTVRSSERAALVAMLASCPRSG